MSESAPSPFLVEHVTLAMDYGQFVLRGGLGDMDDDSPLLEQALAAQPSAGDGSTLVVLSPHQNNFEMHIDVEVFGSRPADDNAEWQQICEGILHIGPEGVLHIDSPTTDPVEVRIPFGEYLVQIAGRGFVTYGWPGTTTPGDVWRISLFPDDGTGPRPAVQWDMPGYGVPENAVLAPDPAPVDDEPRWITVLHEDGSHHMVQRTELEQQATQHQLDEWGGGPPIERLTRYNGGQLLTKFDRPFVETILHCTPDVARMIAVYAATLACEFSSLSGLPWIQPALEALGNNSRLPAPFADTSQMTDAFARLSSPNDTSTASVTISRSTSDAASNPFGTNNEPRYMTIPALYSAQEYDPYKAAIETVVHASHAYGPRAPELHAAIKRDLLDMDRASRGHF